MLPGRTFNAKAFDYYASLSKVRMHFETKYSQSFSLSDAAEIAGLETKHFGKFFRSKVGIGFKAWTTLIRIQFAIDLIQKQDQPLIDIAFAIGFQDLRTFERAFKKQTGLTAREFRQMVIAQMLDVA